MSDSHESRSGDEPAEWEPVGRAIKLERTARAWERKDLAERAGLSYPYLSEIESGRKRPSAKALMQIARALGIPMSELLQGAESIAPESELWGAAPMTAARVSSPAWFHDREQGVRRRARGGDERAALLEELLAMVEHLSTEDLEHVRNLVKRFAQSKP